MDARLAQRRHGRLRTPPGTPPVDGWQQIGVGWPRPVGRPTGQFYESLGFRMDIDHVGNEDFRVVQLTPPASECSIIIGNGITSAAPGSLEGLQLLASDIEAARDELVGRGVEVGKIFHDPGGTFYHLDPDWREPGPDLERGDYGSFATFSDPDGNAWVLQEVKQRPPDGDGNATSSIREENRPMDGATLTDLSKEAEEHHGPYEATAPKHHWSGWYAAYIIARQEGCTPEEASKDGAADMEGVLAEQGSGA